jgi:hypothetical protein
MEYELPEALIEEQTGREISAEQRGADTKRQRLHEPARIDDFQRLARRAPS